MYDQPVCIRYKYIYMYACMCIQIFNSKKILLPNQQSTSVVLYVLRADGVLAGHAVYNVHAVPMTGNNADGSGGDLWPNAGLEMKKKHKLQFVGLVARCSRINLAGDSKNSSQLC